ncbi:hypothetical protein HPT27_02810 [Permianibacter sp. IMCC34836]|uniref:BPSS1780 family membrane protein n=1 Tax=Permianibacter fluminis TaxID=2738515 RepID=UPI0015552EB1|nr:BPSS1780 family membrane protein [Permianibacter fluminis]NQD35937.1 hypothetical protein [Permianibacter fluminis]
MTNQNSNNPYQPPVANVEPPMTPVGGDFIDGGRTVPAGNAANWLGEAWRLFAKSPGIWIANMLILFVLAMMVNFVPILGGLASSVLTPVIIGGLMLGCRELDGGGQLKIEHLFAGFKTHAGPLMLLGLLVLVAIVAVIIVLTILAMLFLGAGFFSSFSGGESAILNFIGQYGLKFLLIMLLLYMALIIPVSMAYWFAPALIVLHGIEPLAAMKQSFKGCLRNFLPFLLYGILLLILMIIGMIPLLLGLLVVVPMMYASMYTAYKDIYLR